MEILNQVTLAGNLTDKPSVDDAGGRVFVRAHLAQNWFYDTHGKTIEHRQFLPLTFLRESASVARSFEKGDNIHVTGQLIRRDPRARSEDASRPAKQEVFSRSTSFEHFVSRVPRNPTPPRSTKTKFVAPMMRNRFLHLFRRAFMIGLSNPKFRSRLASLSRLSYIVIAFAVAFVGLTLAGVGFGFVFNFTHSAPFGLYKEIADPAKAPHTPAPYVFFCPDVRWPGMKGEPTQV